LTIGGNFKTHEANGSQHLVGGSMNLIPNGYGNMIFLVGVSFYYSMPLLNQAVP